MQLKIEMKLPHGTEVLTVDLLNNPGVAIWAEHCKTSTNIRTVIKQPIAPAKYATIDSSSDLWTQQQLVQSMLAPTRLPLPMPVSTPEEITQQHLNVWHRWFTNNTKDIHADNVEYAFEFHWLHEVNQIVHRLEAGIWEWPRSELGLITHEFNFQPPMNQHGIGAAFVDLDRQYHSWDHYDVILDQAVHGKTTMQSFMDNDDPKNWDTTGHHISWGGFKLVNGTHRQDIYQGNMFCDWMDRNNVTRDDLWGDYPLGNIVNKDQDRLDRICKYSSTDFESVNVAIVD